jgi:hypothetical protein
MRKSGLLVAIFLLAAYFMAHSQVKNNNGNQTILLEDIYRDWLSRGTFRRVTCDTLYYTATIEPSIIDSTIARIAADKTFKIYSLYSKSGSDPLVLTEKEQSYLIDELKKLKQYKWPAGMFPASKAIGQGEIEATLGITEKLKTENERNMCSIIYTFSKPIYLRDSTIALYLAQQRYRTNYTQLEYDFYIKDENRWERYAQVYIHYEHEKSK